MTGLEPAPDISALPVHADLDSISSTPANCVGALST